MRKLSGLLITAGIILFGVGWGLTAYAEPPEKVTICHVAGRADDPANHITLTLPWVAVYGQAGHFYENGTPRAGHEQDYLGECDPPETTTTTSTTTTTTTTEVPPETTTTTTVYVPPPFNPPPVITTTTAPPETTTTVAETTTTTTEVSDETSTTTVVPPPTSPPPPPPTTPPAQPRLPETGGEAWYIAAIGGLLTLAGLGARRAAKL